jgi:hypothetical protein
MYRLVSFKDAGLFVASFQSTWNMLVVKRKRNQIDFVTRKINLQRIGTLVEIKIMCF